MLGGALFPPGSDPIGRRAWDLGSLICEPFTPRNAADWPVPVGELRRNPRLADAPVGELTAQLHARLRADTATVLGECADYRDRDGGETLWDRVRDRCELPAATLGDVVEALRSGGRCWSALSGWEPAGGVDGDPFLVARYRWAGLLASVKLDAHELLARYLAGEADLTLYRTVIDAGGGRTEFILASPEVRVLRARLATRRRRPDPAVDRPVGRPGRSLGPPGGAAAGAGRAVHDLRRRQLPVVADPPGGARRHQTPRGDRTPRRPAGGDARRRRGGRPARHHLQPPAGGPLMAALTVAIAGRPVAELTETAAGGPRLRWRGDYRSNAAATPLSLSLPAAEAECFDGDRVAAWLWGLLPDAPNLIAHWVATGVSPAPRPVALLAAPIGRDCAGAVSFHPPGGAGLAAETTGETRWLVRRRTGGAAVRAAGGGVCGVRLAGHRMVHPHRSPPQGRHRPLRGPLGHPRSPRRRRPTSSDSQG